MKKDTSANLYQQCLIRLCSEVLPNVLHNTSLKGLLLCMAAYWGLGLSNIYLRSYLLSLYLDAGKNAWSQVIIYATRQCARGNNLTIFYRKRQIDVFVFRASVPLLTIIAGYFNIKGISGHLCRSYFIFANGTSYAWSSKLKQQQQQQQQQLLYLYSINWSLLGS